jgi:hypothetical protein
LLDGLRSSDYWLSWNWADPMLCRKTLPKLKIAYQDFLAVWKADPDIPIVKQAKAEYAKLQ